MFDVYRFLLCFFILIFSIIRMNVHHIAIGRKYYEMSPPQFLEFDKQAKDILIKDYNYDQRFTFQAPSSSRMELTLNGLAKNQLFSGDVSTLHKAGNVAIDIRVDTFSNVYTKISRAETLPGVKTIVSFMIPDNKSGKLDVHYVHPYATINSSIGLHHSPLLDFNAAIGTGHLSLGGELGFDTTSGAITKCNAGINFKTYDLSASLMFTKKGQALKASYFHVLDSSSLTAIAAEVTHEFSSDDSNMCIGSSHGINQYTMLKARISNDGKVGMLCQHEWRPKSQVTISCEFDTMATSLGEPKLGLALALKP